MVSDLMIITKAFGPSTLMMEGYSSIPRKQVKSARSLPERMSRNLDEVQRIPQGDVSQRPEQGGS